MRLLAAAAAIAALSGCLSVSVGAGDAPAFTYFVLADARPASAKPSASGAAAKLAIQGTGADPLADSTALVYSRREGERALYQFAAWTERPSRRLAQLAQQRLEAGGQFATVAQLGQPVATDWLLTLAVDTLVHDVSASPGRAQIVLRAELVDRRDRRLAARRTFSASAPVAEVSSAAAVQAFGTATAELLDQLAPWVETTVAAARR
jgi:ABC-type uncharacterized transport system auxiliary subunit